MKKPHVGKYANFGTGGKFSHSAAPKALIFLMFTRTRV